jgi:hypothetical protein
VSIHYLDALTQPSREGGMWLLQVAAMMAKLLGAGAWLALYYVGIPFALPSAKADTVFHYTSSPLSGGGGITASLYFSCPGPCAAGHYLFGQGGWNAVSMTYDGNTYSYPQASPTGNEIVLGADQTVVQWVIQFPGVSIPEVANSAYLFTHNTTGPTYEPFNIADGVILVTGSIILGNYTVVETNSKNQGSWVITDAPLTVPGPVFGGGIPGLIMAIVGFIGWGRSRRIAA